jgi:hypothetical protein
MVYRLPSTTFESSRPPFVVLFKSRTAPLLGSSRAPIVTWAYRLVQEKKASVSRRIVRKLKHTVNKVPSLRDFARRSGERNNLAVFIVFILLLIFIVSI